MTMRGVESFGFNPPQEAEPSLSVTEADQWPIQSEEQPTVLSKLQKWVRYGGSGRHWGGSARGAAKVPGGGAALSEVFLDRATTVDPRPDPFPHGRVRIRPWAYPCTPRAFCP